MKVRKGLVSNSSSSSFILEISDITPIQLDQIENHIEVAKALELDDANEHFKWNIRRRAGCLLGKTSMDNFDMRRFMSAIGIDINKVDWEKYG